MNETKWRVHWRNKITGEIKEWSIAGTRENVKKSIAIYDATDTHCTHWLQPDGTAPALKAGTEPIRWRVWIATENGGIRPSHCTYSERDVAQEDADASNNAQVKHAIHWIQPELIPQEAKVEPTKWVLYYCNPSDQYVSRDREVYATKEIALSEAECPNSLIYWVQPEDTDRLAFNASIPIRWRVHSRTKDGRNTGKWMATHETREQAEATIGSWLAWSILDYWVQPEVAEKATPTIILNGATFPPGWFWSNADPLPIWGTGIVSCFPRFSVDPAANPFDPLTVSTMYNPKFSFADFLWSGKSVAAEKKPEPPVKIPVTNEAFPVYRVVQSGAFECGVPQVEWPIDFKDAESARDHAELLKEFFPSLAYWVRTVRGVRVKPAEPETPKRDPLFSVWKRHPDRDPGTVWTLLSEQCAKDLVAVWNHGLKAAPYFALPDGETPKPYERNWEFHSIFRDSTDSITPYHVIFSQRIGSACTVAKYAFREIAYSHANRLMDLDPRKADAEIDGIYAGGKK